MGGVRVCDQGGRLICKRWEWVVGGTVVGPLWEDWRVSITVCLRGMVIVRGIDVRRWASAVRNLLCLFEETGGN